MGFNTSFTWANIGMDFEDHKYIYLRATHAFAGSWLAPIVFLACEQMGLSLPASAVGAALVVFDNGYACISRFVFTDAFLFFFLVMSVYTSFKVCMQSVHVHVVAVSHLHNVSAGVQHRAILQHIAGERTKRPLPAGVVVLDRPMRYFHGRPMFSQMDRSRNSGHHWYASPSIIWIWYLSLNGFSSKGSGSS